MGGAEKAATSEEKAGRTGTWAVQRRQQPRRTNRAGQAWAARRKQLITRSKQIHPWPEDPACNGA
eukprot:9388295-Prorocentrum_lima.AAC.1